jgi:hypothetical protein
VTKALCSIYDGEEEMAGPPCGRRRGYFVITGLVTWHLRPHYGRGPGRAAPPIYSAQARPGIPRK